jgi:hypothetical protein
MMEHSHRTYQKSAHPTSRTSGHPRVSMNPRAVHCCADENSDRREQAGRASCENRGGEASAQLSCRSLGMASRIAGLRHLDLAARPYPGQLSHPVRDSTRRRGVRICSCMGVYESARHPNRSATGVRAFETPVRSVFRMECYGHAECAGRGRLSVVQRMRVGINTPSPNSHPETQNGLHATRIRAVESQGRHS